MGISELKPREKFLKAYANLPEMERSQIIAIVDNRTYSWDRAYDEISQDTKLGKKMVEKLVEVGIL